ncbi:hypothetical protein CG007_02975 [Mesoplasma entomophilum]|uniref:Uncharacterized protein n=1 Tax=Mesoplasma entomophilum TaxID=2149 RepID=A0A3S5Y0B5_9MOLU|nr:hypothetical protein [Mesoplasma entomophilum]ATQ35732.1 hypothetical protein CS528_03145 [Mesoplasma entomophilum]ATZ19701.1 hypothetical protein MENTO_v1c06000 [Mesoplasma entomophilum]AVN60551.1 hypothetical protein CG007_02975 [Mesoplasma entomophilum]
MKNNLEKLDKIKINEKLNNKVFRDFIKYFENKNKQKISKKLLTEFETIVNKIATYNDHKFVKQSDLFGMLFIQQNEIEDFSEKFKEAIRETMFKEVINYQTLNSNLKDEFEIKYNEKSLTKEEKEHASKLVKWIRKQVEIFSNEKLINENPQLENQITGELTKEFFKEQNEIFIKIYKWHANVFEVMAK